MLVPLAFVAFWPRPVDEPIAGTLTDILQFLHSYGISGWFDYKFLEASANVTFFVPLGFVAALAFPENAGGTLAHLGGSFPAVWKWVSSCFFTIALQVLSTS